MTSLKKKVTNLISVSIYKSYYEDLSSTDKHTVDYVTVELLSLLQPENCIQLKGHIEKETDFWVTVHCPNSGMIFEISKKDLFAGRVGKPTENYCECHLNLNPGKNIPVKQINPPVCDKCGKEIRLCNGRVEEEEIFQRQLASAIAERIGTGK